MNDAIYKALCRALHEANSNGEPLTPTPEHLTQSGPCPHCGWRIDPSEFSTLAGPQKKGTEVVGLIVCGGCCAPVIYRQGGKFERLSKKMLKSLSKSSIGFIERSQALVRAIKNRVN